MRIQGHHDAISKSSWRIGWEKFYSSTFTAGAPERREGILDEISKMNIDFNGKKILCLSGGIGRNADALRQLGAIVYNSDIDHQTINIGKNTYPKVNHLVYDINDKPLRGFDYVLPEFVWHESTYMGYMEELPKWQGYATILPFDIPYKIYKFNSKLLTNYYRQVEPLGELFIKKSWENIGVMCYGCETEVEDLVIEDKVMNTSSWELDVPDCDTHDYQVWANPRIFGLPRTYFRGRFINNGIFMCLDHTSNKLIYTNQRNRKKIDKKQDNKE
jgi:hypothetical protein|tara:strand:- start:137 stop:955 length:819 start_codon:yes stop_codon:yes gene_type:complete